MTQQSVNAFLEISKSISAKLSEFLSTAQVSDDEKIVMKRWLLIELERVIDRSCVDVEAESIVKRFYDFGSDSGVFGWQE